MNILSSFNLAPEKLRYLIVVVDYFTKWIEVRELANITTSNIIKFYKKNILARLGMPKPFSQIMEHSS